MCYIWVSLESSSWRCWEPELQHLRPFLRLGASWNVFWVPKRELDCLLDGHRSCISMRGLSFDAPSSFLHRWQIIPAPYASPKTLIDVLTRSLKRNQNIWSKIFIFILIKSILKVQNHVAEKLNRYNFNLFNYKE